MLYRTGDPITFAAQFVSSNVGKTGLTVTVSIKRINSDASVSSVVTSTATEGEKGWYFIILNGSATGTVGTYICTFTTTGTADQKDIATIGIVGTAALQHIDADVSSRSTLTAGAQMDLVDAPNATAVTAIQSLLALEATAQDASAHALSADQRSANVQARLPSDLYNGRMNSSVGEYQPGLEPTSDLTPITDRIGPDITGTGTSTVSSWLRAMSRINVTSPTGMGGTYNPAHHSLEALRTELPGAIFSAGTVTGRVPGRGGSLLLLSFVDWTVNLSGLGDISDRSELYFTIKLSRADTDEDSIVQVSETGGLLWVESNAPEDSSLGVLTVIDAVAGTATVLLQAEATAAIRPRESMLYEVKIIRTTTGADTIPVISGKITSVQALTRALE